MSLFEMVPGRRFQSPRKECHEEADDDGHYGGDRNSENENAFGQKPCARSHPFYPFMTSAQDDPLQLHAP
jgi:hypothetical protein